MLSWVISALQRAHSQPENIYCKQYMACNVLHSMYCMQCTAFNVLHAMYCIQCTACNGKLGRVLGSFHCVQTLACSLCSSEDKNTSVDCSASLLVYS